jgi:hypothetical protein
MKKFLAILVLMVLVSVAPAFALEADYIPMSFVFPLVSNTVASTPTSIVAFVAPENITLKSVYVTDVGGITANATDSLDFNLLDDGVVIQSYITTTALVAMTPKAFTLATAAGVNRIAKGSVVTANITVNGAGAAQTTPNILINYTIGW